MTQIGVIGNEGDTHLHDRVPCAGDHSSDDFRRMNRAAHVSALGIFLKNFPLEVFDTEEREWFTAIQSRVCRMESNAFDDLGIE